MNSNRISDSVFEALFRQAVLDNFDDEINSIPADDILKKTYSFSNEFELRMKKVFAVNRRREVFVRFFYYGRKVAVIIVITFSCIFTLLLSYPEVRAAIGNVLVEWYEQFTTFSFPKETTNNPNIHWIPEYLPDGFTYNEMYEFGETTNIIYTNDAGVEISITFRPSTNSTNMSIDNENHDIEECYIGGNNAYTARSKSFDFDNAVIWSMHGYTFDIWSKLSVDELVKVAESIKEIND